MKFTGTLIEDLMATVERAEHRVENRAQSDGALILGATIGEPLIVETSQVEAWFASVQEISDYDPKILGVA
ncbi:MAG: hypothetical protein ABSD76_11895 [Terriglobales bacterium]|jgi:hypothetical protein